jgi:hypothetical protein
MYISSITLLHRTFLDSLTCSNYEFQAALNVCRKNALRSVGVYIEVDRDMQEGGRLHDDEQISSSLSVNDFLISTALGHLELFNYVGLP